MTIQILNEKQLKIIAIICMFIDHFTCIAIPQDTTLYVIIRLITRTGFIIFAFMIAEGDRYTKNRGKYLTRLLLFAIISEPIYDWFFYGKVDLYHQNIFFTLFIGELALYIFSIIKKYKNINKKIQLLIQTLLMILAAIVFFIIANIINCSYGGAGIILIILFSILWNRKGKNANIYKILLICVVMTILWIDNPIQLFSLLTIIFVLPLYNGKREKQRFSLIYYVIYPLHLLLIGGIVSILIKFSFYERKCLLLYYK